MNRTQHLDNPPLPIRAIDCPRHVVPATEPESRGCFTKLTDLSLPKGDGGRTQNFALDSRLFAMVYLTKQSQISSFSIENKSFIEKQSQIKPKMPMNPDAYRNASYGVLRNEPKIERFIPTEGGSEIRRNNGRQNQS